MGRHNERGPFELLELLILRFFFVVMNKMALTFESVTEFTKFDYFKSNLLSSTFIWYCYAS